MTGRMFGVVIRDEHDHSKIVAKALMVAVPNIGDRVTMSPRGPARAVIARTWHVIPIDNVDATLYVD